jgi:hypothetical protein
MFSVYIISLEGTYRTVLIKRRTNHINSENSVIISGSENIGRYTSRVLCVSRRTLEVKGTGSQDRIKQL